MLLDADCCAKLSGAYVSSNVYAYGKAWENWKAAAWWPAKANSDADV